MQPVLPILTTAALWNLLLEPVANWPRLSLLVLGFLLGLLTAWLLRRLTPKHALYEIRQQTRAEFLAWRLFADQPGTWWRALSRLTLLTLRRLASLLPGCLLLAPLGYWIWLELDQRYQHRPLIAGEQALISFQWSETTWPEAASARLETNAALEIVSGPLRDAQHKLNYWSLRSLTGEVGSVTLHLPASTTSWDLQATNQPDRLTRVEVNPLVRATAPGSPPVRLHIEYPPRELTMLGLRMPWWGMLLCGFFAGHWLAGRLYPAA